MAGDTVLYSAALSAFPAGNILVTPLGGSQTTLAAALAGTGGNPKLAVVAATANETLGTLPAGAYLMFALFRETTGNEVSVSIGTTTGGSDVMEAVAVPGNGTLSATTNAFSKVWFSAVATQTLYLASASWGGASINCWLVYQLGP